MCPIEKVPQLHTRCFALLVIGLSLASKKYPFSLQHVLLLLLSCDSGALSSRYDGFYKSLVGHGTGLTAS